MINKPVFLYLAANILSALIGFAMLPIVTRVLTPSEYGVFSIFQSLSAAAGIFVGLNSQGLLLRKIFVNSEVAGLKAYVTLTILVALLSWLFSALLSLLIFNIIEIELTFFQSLLAITLSLFVFIVRIRTVLYQGFEQPIFYAFYQVGGAFLIFVSVILFVVYFEYGVDGRIVGAVIGPLFFSFLAIYSLIRNKLIVLMFSKRVLKEILDFGMPLLPHAIFGVSFLYVDRWVIAANLGYDSVGIYGAILQIVAPVTLLFDAFNKAYVPWLYKKLANEKRDFSLLKHQIMVLFVIVVGAIIAFFVLKYVSSFILPENYQAPDSVMFYVFISIVFLGFYQMPNNVLFFFKKTGSVSVVTGIGFLIYLIALYFTIEPFGLTGVAVSFFISVGVRCVLSLILSNFHFINSQTK